MSLNSKIIELSEEISYMRNTMQQYGQQIVERDQQISAMKEEQKLLRMQIGELLA